MSRTRWTIAAALIAGLVWVGGSVGANAGSPEQIPVVDGSKFAGLKWTFVRIKYNSYEDEGGQASRLAYWDEPWAIDAPAAEQNLSRRIKAVTAIDVGEPIVLTLEDPKLWENPDLHRRAEQPVVERRRGPDPSRVPAAGRNVDL